MKMLLGICRFALVFVVVVSTTASAQQTFIPVEALRAGGFTILFRHTAVRVTQDRQPLDLSDCAAQHPLGEQGRADARNVGAAFRSLGIPVGRVLASPYCRTIETAQLAFGRAEPWIPLVHPAYVPIGVTAPPPSMAERVESIRKVLDTSQAGTNTVLVTHGQVILAVAGVQIEEGEMAIFRPTGTTTPRLVARVMPSAWVQTAGLK